MSEGLDFLVLCPESGDRAYAADPESALVAARALQRDHVDAHAARWGTGVQAPAISVYYLGKHVITVERGRAC